MFGWKVHLGEILPLDPHSGPAPAQLCSSLVLCLIVLHPFLLVKVQVVDFLSLVGVDFLEVGGRGPILALALSIRLSLLLLRMREVGEKLLHLLLAFPSLDQQLLQRLPLVVAFLEQRVEVFLHLLVAAVEQLGELLNNLRHLLNGVEGLERNVPVVDYLFDNG